MPVSYKIKDSSAGILFDRLKAYISGSHSLVREFFIRLGNLKTVRILTYYPGTAGILAREFGWSLIPPIAHPDATIRLWQETGCRDFVSRVLGLDPGQVIEGESWTELIRCAPDGELYPMGTIDSDGPWGVHMSLGNEYFYGLDGLEPGAWFKDGHFFVQALFRILNRDDNHSLVHGACIGRNGSGVLMCARGNGGKSTLSVTSLLRGFEFVSDDYLILEKDREGLFASPIYSFITLSPQMYDRMYDDLDRARFLGISSWKGKYVLDISGYGERFREHYPVKALLFPEITPDAAEPSVVPCSAQEKGRTLVQIAHSTTFQMWISGLKGEQRDADFIRKTLGMLTGLPCYRIVLSPDIEANARCLAAFIDKTL